MEKIQEEVKIKIESLKIHVSTLHPFLYSVFCESNMQVSDLDFRKNFGICSDLPARKNWDGEREREREREREKKNQTPENLRKKERWKERQVRKRKSKINFMFVRG